jgi:hypothetical protein
MVEIAHKRDRIRNTLQRWRFWIAILFIPVAAPSCLEEIDLEVPSDIAESFVIQGKLVMGDTSKILVSVSRLFDFGTNSLRPVPVQQVILKNDAGQEMELGSTTLGIYEADIPPDGPVEIGTDHMYQLDVLTLDRRHYVSDWESLLPVPPVMALNVRTVERDILSALGDVRTVEHFQFSIDASLRTAGATENSFILWEMERTYKLTDSPVGSATPQVCYVTERVDIGDVDVVNGSTLEDTEVNNVILFETDKSYHFSEGLFFTVHQQSLNRGAFDYWNQIGQSVERTGNMFEPPAGRLTTNFSNVDDPEDQVFGYFFATAVETVRMYMSPETVGNPGQFCPPPGPPSPGPCPTLEMCCDCTIIPGSSLVKPRFWTE